MTAIVSDRHNYNYVVTFCLSMLVGSIVSSCSEAKYAQCEQIIQIANGVVSEKNRLLDTNNSLDIESKTWLEAARIMTRAAQNLEDINLQDPELITYQADLAQVYRLYSQATYDAVKAWENKNIKALQLAHTDAKRAGQLEAKLGNMINSYCGDRQK